MSHNFQSYTNTYAPVSYLEPLFSEAIAHRMWLLCPSELARTACRRMSWSFSPA